MIGVSKIPKQVPDEPVPLHGTVLCRAEIPTCPSKQHSLAQDCLDSSTLILIPGLVPSVTSQGFLLNAYLTVDIFPSTQKRVLEFLDCTGLSSWNIFYFHPPNQGCMEIKSIIQYHRSQDFLNNDGI